MCLRSDVSLQPLDFYSTFAIFIFLYKFLLILNYMRTLLQRIFFICMRCNVKFFIFERNLCNDNRARSHGGCFYPTSSSIRRYNATIRHLCLVFPRYTKKHRVKKRISFLDCCMLSRSPTSV